MHICPTQLQLGFFKPATYIAHNLKGFTINELWDYFQYPLLSYSTPPLWKKKPSFSSLSLSRKQYWLANQDNFKNKNSNFVSFYSSTLFRILHISLSRFSNYGKPFFVKHVISAGYVCNLINNKNPMLFPTPL